MKNLYLKVIFAVLLAAFGVAVLGTHVAFAAIQATVVPTTPDGSNGYFRTTQPYVHLSGYSAMSYKIDGGAWNEGVYKTYAITQCSGISITPNYGGVLVPAGTHTIYYMIGANCGGTIAPGDSVGVGAVTVKYDPNPPIVSLTNPVDNSVTDSSPVTVTGTATDLESQISSLTINGTSVSVGSNGNFSTLMGLSVGLNRVLAVAVDLAGNSTTKELFFTYISKPVDSNSGSAGQGNNNGGSVTAKTQTNGSGQVLGKDTETQAVGGVSASGDSPVSTTSTKLSSENQQKKDGEATAGGLVKNSLFPITPLVVILSGFILLGSGLIVFKTGLVSKFHKIKLKN